MFDPGIILLHIFCSWSQIQRLLFAGKELARFLGGLSQVMDFVSLGKR